MINLPVNVGLQGSFKLTVLDKNRNPVKDKCHEFHNLIVNSGLNLLGTVELSTAVSYCRVGTSNTAPAAGQTDLGARHGTPTFTIVSGYPQTGSQIATEPKYHFITRVYEFAAGTIDGAALAEVGLFNGASGAMFARALIKDGEGDPTTITLLSDEILQVQYTIRIYPPTGDVTGTVTIDSVSYDYTLRVANRESLGVWVGTSGMLARLQPDWCYAFESQTLGAETAAPTGTYNQSAGIAKNAYEDGTYRRDCGGTFAIGTANFASGIGVITWGYSAGNNAVVYQCSFAATSGGTKIPKDNTKQLRLNGALRVSWSNYVE